MAITPLCKKIHKERYSESITNRRPHKLWQSYNLLFPHVLCIAGSIIQLGVIILVANIPFTLKINN